MQLKLESNKSGLMLFVITGPLETYVPNKEIEELFSSVMSLSKEIKEMEEKIKPKIKELQDKVFTFNKIQSDNIPTEEELT